jgi:hypothetical protein
MTTPKTIAEAYADAARPAMTDREAFANDEWEPESPDYIRGWNDCMMKTHKLVPIETPAMTGVKVKPLVWSAEDNGEFIAVAEVGWYHIGRPASSWNLTTPFGDVLSFWDDLDAAKAAAQADYESRILAAIVPPADLALLSDPNAVHLNMLRGSIAKPTIAQIIHIYGIDALCKALAPEIVREAGEQPAPWTPPEDRRGNFECLGKVRGFWVQVGWKQAMDDTWNWYALLDKNPLPVAPATFAPLPSDVGQPAPWMPPEDRPNGYECLGWIEANRSQTIGVGGWEKVQWKISVLRPPGYWWCPHGGEQVSPTAFAPLPGDAA